MSAEPSASDPLVASMRQAAAAEREQVLAEAREQVARIEAAAERAVAALEAEARERAARTVGVETDRVRHQAEADLRRRRAALRQRLLDAVFAAAAEQVAARLQSDAGLGRRLLQRAGAALGRGARTDEAALSAVSADGRRRVVNSPAARLARARTLLTPEIAALLFGTDSDA